MEGLTIREYQARDRTPIESVLRRSPEAADWLPAGDGKAACWVAETRAGVLGFVVARAVADEMEILNMAVDPPARRQGAGAALLAAALAYGRRAGARRAFLEVRESNQPARLFYGQCGFVPVGRRRGYYRGPEEDAVLMEFALSHSA